LSHVEILKEEKDGVERFYERLTGLKMGEDKDDEDAEQPNDHDNDDEDASDEEGKDSPNED